MKLSAQGYEKAKKILAFVEDNPGSYMHEIAEAISTLKGTTHIIVQKMAQAGVLSYTTKKYRGGKRHFYTATGKPLPHRVPMHAPKAEQVTQATHIDPVEVHHFKAMPAFMRAITPVITPVPIHSVAYFGHTDEQHRLQSAILHKEHAAAHRGAIFTGESRL